MIQIADEIFALLPTLGPAPFAVYVYLISTANSDGVASPGYREMHERLGMSYQSISRYLSILEAQGLVIPNRKFRQCTAYFICNPLHFRGMELTTTSILKEDVDSNPLKCRGLEDEQPTLGPLSSAFVESTHLPELTGGPQRYIKAIEKMNSAGVTPDDLRTAVREMTSKGYNISGPWSVISGAMMAMSKRKRAIENEPAQPYLEYVN